MRYYSLCLLLACGPSVGSSDDESTSGDASTGTSATVSTTIDPTNGTSATTASTSATTASTTATTTVGTFGDDTTDATTDEPDDTTMGFIIDPDGGGPLCSSLSFCDVWAQDCARGTKCMPWDCPGGDATWSSTTCSPLAENPADVGEPCTVVDALYSGADDCGVSAMCWNPDPDTLVGECVAFCSGSEANRVCEDASTTCFMGWDGVIILCLPRCHPLASTCDAGEACMFDADSNEGAFVCMPEVHVDPQTYGDDCSDALACGTGLVCREAAHVPGCAGTHCCSTLGDAAAPPVCPDATQTCLPLYPDGDAPAGLENLCFCGVPE